MDLSQKNQLKIIAVSKPEQAKLLLPIFIDSVQAGYPSPAEDYIETALDLNELMVQHPAATFFVRVQGDSMKNAGIYSGDILVVDRSLSPSNGKIVVAIIDGEFTVKRLSINNGELYLVPENDSFVKFKVEEYSDFQVWGVVTFVIHKVF